VEKQRRQKRLGFFLGGKGLKKSGKGAGSGVKLEIGGKKKVLLMKSSLRDGGRGKKNEGKTSKRKSSGKGDDEREGGR